MPDAADSKEKALEEALERAVRIIEDAEARGADPVLDALDEHGPDEAADE